MGRDHVSVGPAPGHQGQTKWQQRSSAERTQYFPWVDTTLSDPKRWLLALKVRSPVLPLDFLTALFPFMDSCPLSESSSLTGSALGIVGLAHALGGLRPR